MKNVNTDKIFTKSHFLHGRSSKLTHCVLFISVDESRALYTRNTTQCTRTYAYMNAYLCEKKIFFANVRLLNTRFQPLFCVPTIPDSVSITFRTNLFG